MQKQRKKQARDSTSKKLYWSLISLGPTEWQSTSLSTLEFPKDTLPITMTSRGQLSITHNKTPSIGSCFWLLWVHSPPFHQEKADLLQPGIGQREAQTGGPAEETPTLTLTQVSIRCCVPLQRPGSYYFALPHSCPWRLEVITHPFWFPLVLSTPL